MKTLMMGDLGNSVTALQRALNDKGFAVTTSGVFDAATEAAVVAFQMSHLDPRGQPLHPDGIVGPLTWFALTNEKPDKPGVDYLALPATGGSRVGRLALIGAIGELHAGAGEIGGNNMGPFVRKYLAPAGLPEGSSWCASFVSWCYLQAVNGQLDRMPFPYNPSARGLLSEFKERGWTTLDPQPGDVVVWWRGDVAGWQGHTGIVHSVRDGLLYTIEGNRSPKVAGFSYVLSRIEQLLGYGHVPDAA